LLLQDILKHSYKNRMTGTSQRSGHLTTHLTKIPSTKLRIQISKPLFLTTATPNFF
jgi:hypothetical protein